MIEKTQLLRKLNITWT